MNNQRNHNCIGQRYNHWTVIDVVYNDNRKEYEWVCQCDCGNIVQQRVYNIRNGKSKHCRQCIGGIKKSSKKSQKIKKEKNAIDTHIGKIYGELTVLDEYYDKKRKARMFKCKCSCGGERIVRKYEVLNGSITHCGGKVHRMYKHNNDKIYIGKRYGSLTVQAFDYDKEKKVVLWVCKCDCGNIRTVVPNLVKNGSVKSCKECVQKTIIQNNKELNKTHGLSDTRIYHIWLGMRDRCKNPKNDSYKYYGGRGIKVCKEWNESFESFYKWVIENGYRDDLTIDRINNDGYYEPSNCRWATYKEQNNNKRKPKPRIYLTIDGIEKSLKEWSKESEFTTQAIVYRLNVKNMPPKEAVFGKRKAYTNYIKWGEDL